MGIKQLFIANYRLMKIAFKQIALFELLYKAIYVLLIFPLSGFLFELSIKLSGFQYLTNGNLSSYLAKPMTWLMILFIILLNLLYLLGEFVTLTICFQAARTQAPIRFWRAFSTGIRKTCAMLWPKNMGMLAVGLFTIPLVNNAVLLALLATFRLPGAVTRFFATQPLVLVGVILFLIITELFAFSVIFTMHCYTIHKRRFKNAIKEAIHLLKRHRVRVLVQFLLWNILILGLILLAYFIVISAIVLIILIANVKQGVELALFLYWFRIANLILMALSAIFGLLANLAFITNLFNYYCRSDSDYRVLEVVKLVQPREGKRPRRAVTAILVSVVLLLNGVYVYLLLDDAAVNYLSELGVPAITSHRGNSVAAPENTMLAIEYAVRDLSDSVEIDVQETADGELIVIHDTNLFRTTGLKKNVWETEYNEIQDLDAGFWFDPKLQNAKVPKFSEVLEYCQKKKIKLNVELKGYEHSKKLEETVVKRIEEYNMVSQCDITSFNYNSLKKVKKINKEIKTGYIVSQSYGSFYQMKYADFFSVRATNVTKTMVDNIHGAGKQIHVWTVNGEQGIRNMMELGVDNIITDNPVLAREVIYSNNATTGLLSMFEVIFG